MENTEGNHRNCQERASKSENVIAYPAAQPFRQNSSKNECPSARPHILMKMESSALALSDLYWLSRRDTTLYVTRQLDCEPAATAA